MLDDAFTHLSPRLATRYHALLDRELADSPELADMHRAYTDYARLDAHLPRPILAYFGYHALAEGVDFTDLDDIGDALLIPQLLRDVLAIHDDVVDEDLDKFGAQPLPVALSGGSPGVLTEHGKNLALFYADLLVGVMLRVTTTLPSPIAAAISHLIGQILYTNQRGQLAELRAETRPLTDTTIDDVLCIGERKAAYYCYVFPFTLGARLAGHHDQMIAPVVDLLVRIGTASQVIDDLTGAFPGLIDNDKDTLAEIAHLRRTIPMVLLAQHHGDDHHIHDLLTATAPLSRTDALQLRADLLNSSVPRRASALCTSLITDISVMLADLPTGRATTTYLRDLVQHRLVTSVDRLQAAV